jgi:2-amino-4-hydroxy-6-hydroxymethyldihydropteridine diphosphokinase
MPKRIAAPVTAYIGLGANLGNPHLAVLAAIEAIADVDGLALTRKSSLYGSAPVVNAVVEVLTNLKPQALLEQLQAIEQHAGRERSYRNAPRTLDLDVLLYGSKRISTATLVVPHPRMDERAFVLRPLAELAPNVVKAKHLRAVADQSVWLLGS